MLLKPTVFELEDTMLRVKKTSGVQHQLGNSDSPMRVPSQSTPINEQVNNTTNESLLDLSANINTGRAATSISVVKNSEPMMPLIPARVDKKSAPRPSLSQKLSSPAKVRVVEVCEDEEWNYAPTTLESINSSIYGKQNSHISGTKADDIKIALQGLLMQ